MSTTRAKAEDADILGGTRRATEQAVHDALDAHLRRLFVTADNRAGSGVIHGDCLAVLPALDADSVDLVVTSPPYDALREYHGYEFDAEAVIKALYRVVKDGGVCVWVVGDSRAGGVSLTSFEHGLAFRAAGWRMHDVMIYRKRNTPFVREGAYTPCHELMLVAAKGKPKTFNPLMTETARQGEDTAIYRRGVDGDNSKRRNMVLREQKVRENVWDYAVGQGGTTRDKCAFAHPAMFPEQLAADHIRSWSNEGDLVLDPFLGSGTTAKMARALGRRCIGIEVSADYCELARRRLAETADLLTEMA